MENGFASAWKLGLHRDTKTPIFCEFRRFLFRKVLYKFLGTKEIELVPHIFSLAGLERFLPHLLMKTGILLICHFISFRAVPCLPVTWRSKAP